VLDKFCLVGTPEKNVARIQWLLDNNVYPILYPLPRRKRMVEDHHPASSKLRGGPGRWT